MFGVTTPCVTPRASGSRSSATRCSCSTRPARAGESMEALVRAGFLAGVLDATTTELADELVGGVLSAGPDRLEAAGAAGVPQVVSLGALDMVNFGPRETVPERFADRTLLRAQPDRDADAHDARGVRRARPPDRRQARRRRPGRPCCSCRSAGSRRSTSRARSFHDADGRRRAASRRSPRRSPASGRARTTCEQDINDPAFARAMADRLHELIRADGMTRRRGARAAAGAASQQGRRSSAPAPAPGCRPSAPRRAAPT